ncbi:MAG: hypothetical protein F6K31_20055 [Symploca sp. SIO2G7]|nr:hypothetical protein [Symploca sp. SIO2G7]
MEYWEFLIQQEGDRTWKPIKSPRIEIEPGRYRVVAHSSLKNAEVEISVIHQSLEEVPPKRRYQKRSRRTSPEGLMVVIPFTQLKSGIWELRCCGDIMSDFMGETWQQFVQLQVGSTVSEFVPNTQPESSLVASKQEVEAESRQKATLPFVHPREESREQKVSTPNAAQELVPTDGDVQPPLPILPLEAVAENPPVEVVQPAVEPNSVETEVALDKQGNRQQATGNRQQATGNAEEFHKQGNRQQATGNRQQATGNTEEFHKQGNRQTPPVSPQGGKATGNTEEFHSIEGAKSSCGALQEQDNRQTPFLPPQEEKATPLDIPPRDEDNSQEDLMGLFPLSELAHHSSDVFQEDQAENKITENGQDSYTTNLQPGDIPIPNPILEQSLQTLEQIMQQVLEPVLDEFEQSESSEPQPLIEPAQILEKSEDDQFSKTITNQLGLILTLEEEALVAHREEQLVIVGQLDVLEVYQLNDQEHQRAWQQIFPGILSYELRDPQTSQVLLNIQYPLAEQAPPLTFSHTLELPENCNSRLLVGKVTFYGSNSQALVGQFFTVTADLDDVLGSILLGGKTMPVETMLAVANHLTTSPEHQQKPTPSVAPPLNQALLDLVDAPPISQPRTWKSSSSNPLPPKLYQRDSIQKSSKSIDLPNFPQQRFNSHQESEVSEVISTEPSPDIPASPPPISSTLLSQTEQIELKQEDAESQSSVNEQLQPEEPVNFGDNLSLETLNQEIAKQEEETSEWEKESADTETRDTPDAENGNATPNFAHLEETAADLPLQLEGIESPDTTAVSATDTQLKDSDSMAEADSSEPEIPLEHNQTPPVNANESESIENKFQALKLQDRFWSRLNSLVIDADSSTCWESDVSTASKPTEVEKLKNKLNSEDVTSQQVEVQEPIEFTEQLPADTVMADFDESLWEVTDDFDDEVNDTDSSFIRLTNTNWVNQEIVVEEELLESPAQTANGDAAGKVDQTEQESKSAPGINHPVASDVSIPAPELFIPTSELSAGEPVTVRIKLPTHSSRLYVKLWVKDRQSRLILDGPRSFVDFVPNASGEQEELTQLIVPFGTVEIRFEAIAIDIYSQRESQKVAVDSKVVSSDLPGISLEEFDA